MQRNRSRRPLFLVLALFASAVIAAEPGLEDDVSVDIEVGVHFQTEMFGQEERRFRASLDPPGYWLVVVDQQGIDVRMAVTPVNQQTVSVDGPTERYGTDSLVIETDDANVVEIALISTSHASVAGTLRLQVKRLDDQNEAALGRIAAEQAASAGNQQFDLGNKEARQRAADFYLESLELWRQLDDSNALAAALFRAGASLGSVRQDQQAIQLLRKASEYYDRGQDSQINSSIWNMIGLTHVFRGEYSDAELAFSEAILAQEQERDHIAFWTLRNNQCLSLHYQGEMYRAIDCYEKVLSAFEGLGNEDMTGLLHNNLGRALDIVGKPADARRHLELSAQIKRTSGDESGEALALSNLALLERRLGHLDRAIPLYLDALEIQTRVGPQNDLSRTLNNLGVVSYFAGQSERARDFLLQALEIRRNRANLGRQASTLTSLADVYRDLGLESEADDAFREAITLRLSIGDKRNEGRAYLMLGESETADDQKAIAHFDRAISVLAQTGDKARLADAWLQKGIRLAVMQTSELAENCLVKALEIFESIENPLGQAEALTEIADLYQQRHDFDQALDSIKQSIAILDSIRARITSPQLRSSFSGVSQRAYEQRVEVLMAMHEQDPGGGHDARALIANDMRLARSLTDLIQQSQIDLYHDIDPQLANQRKVLSEKISATTNFIGRSAGSGEDSPILSRAKQNLLLDLTELDALDMRIIGEDPRISQLTEPEMPSLSGIQRLLGQNDVLLHYFLGTGHSYLWLVGKNSIESHKLAARHEMNAMTRAAYDELSHVTFGDRCPAQIAMRELSEELLGAVADDIAGKRLIIVTDGALSYLPFSALPNPPDVASVRGACSSRLIENHEIVYQPSMMVMSAKILSSNSEPNSNRIAVFADAVYSSSDVRLAATSVKAEASARDPLPGLPPEALPRLIASKDEADSIADIASDWQVDVFTGLEANKSNLIEHVKTGTRVLHLATHGVVDSHRPGLSSILLSRYDVDGQELDGNLRLQDIYGLKIDADLVVLSGCDTALGREIRGEGLVGLTRGFMYAGADSVVASLWRVEDTATADLMAHFYVGLIQEDLSPAAALRRAQIMVSSRPRWRHPYYWAGFVVQGGE